MNTQETLAAIAGLITDHERGAQEWKTDPDPLAVNIRTLLDRHAASIEEKKASRAEWAAEVRSAATLANTIDGGAFGRRLEILLDTAASFVEHGSDLGGGMMPYRFKALAQATVEHAATDAARVHAALDATAVLHEAGNDLFRHVNATAARYCWKAEETLRAAFGFADPDAAPATSDPEKKEN